MEKFPGLINKRKLGACHSEKRGSGEAYQKDVAFRERAEGQPQSDIALLGSSIDDLLAKELDYWKRKRSSAKRNLKSDEVQVADAQLRSLRKSIFEVEESARDALASGDLKGFDAKGFSRLEKAMQLAFGREAVPGNQDEATELQDYDVLDIPECLRRPQTKSQSGDEDEEGETMQRRQCRLF